MTWLEEFEIWLESQTMSTHTIKSYVGDLRQFSDWMGKRQGEDFEAGKLTAVDVRAYQKALQGMKRHPATVNRKINALRTFARFASGKYTGGSIQEEISGLVKKIEEPAPMPRAISKQDSSRLLAAYEREISHEQLKGRTGRYRQAVMQRAILYLQRGGGLRTGEAVALDAGDVVLKERSGYVIVRQGKGGKYAEQPLPAETRYYLAEWIRIRGSQPGALFTSQKGGRLGARQVQRYFAAMCERAGLKGTYTPHSNRHTFIRTLVADPNVPLPEAQKLARHARVEMTLRYAMATEEDLQAAVERVFS